ncbi:MAG: hypothetical protein IIZ48_04540, partial [Erysipelotrichales bacterium]|nr:hypothetical protein [Erysipelotrichales bacterium]
FNVRVVHEEVQQKSEVVIDVPECDTYTIYAECNGNCKVELVAFSINNLYRLFPQFTKREDN